MTTATTKRQNGGGSEGVASDPIVSPRDAAVRLMIRDAHCSLEAAVRAYLMIEMLIETARQQDYAPVYMTTRQLQSKEYRVFEAVIPHGKASQEGSAHAALEAALLDPARDEFGLRHEQRDDRDSLTYCTVQVCLGVLR